MDSKFGKMTDREILVHLATKGDERDNRIDRIVRHLEKLNGRTTKLEFREKFLAGGIGVIIFAIGIFIALVK